MKIVEKMNISMGVRVRFLVNIEFKYLVGGYFIERWRRKIVGRNKDLRYYI